MEKFNIIDGLKVQQDYLEQWKSILQDDKYMRLQLWIDICNGKLTSDNNGYDVVRGVDIDNWIHNNLMSK